MPKQVHAVIHASELLTGAGIARKDGRRPHEEDLGRIPDGALIHSGGEILWVGPTDSLPAEYRGKDVAIEDLGGKRALVPGLIDSHTHLVFAGDRSEEFALRCGGMTYEEIAKRGGGIQTTVRATRAASEEELFRLAIPRVEEAYGYGVRVLEMKSGYGLTTEDELKILRVGARLKKRFPEVKFHSTFLGAHDFPKDRDREEYIRELIDVMIPQVAARGPDGEALADSCDVFIDRGYYTVDEGREILDAARAHGLSLKMHADELACTHSAELASELGALSADHLLKVSDEGVRALAASKTVATLLPGTAFYLRAEHAPARKLLDAGARVAIATDFNPGTCVTLNLPTILTIAALYLRMSRAELLASVTYNAAAALGLEKRYGSLEAGKAAAFTILPFERFEESYYRFAYSR